MIPDIMEKLLKTVSEFRNRLSVSGKWDMCKQNEPYFILVILNNGMWFMSHAIENPNIPDFNNDDVAFISAEFDSPQNGKYRYIDSDYGYRKSPRNILKQLNQYHTDYTKLIE